MKKYINNYFAFLEEKIKGLNSCSYAEQKEFSEELYRHIGFIQHERLIHLLVLCLFAIIFFVCITALICFQAYILILVVILLLVLLIPYIMHYYFLENSTQKLYRLYDALNKTISENKNEN